MSQLFSKHKNLSIQTRLFIYYTLFALVTLLTVMYFSYTQAVKALRSSVDDKLATIAALKVDSLNQWVDEQQSNAIFLSSLPELRALAGQLLGDSSTAQEKAEARTQLEQLLLIIVQRTEDFQDIQVIDNQGNIAVSIFEGNVGKSQADQAFFIEGTSKTFTQTFYQSKLLDRTTITVATPLFDAAQKRVGVLALHFNMKRVDDIFHKKNGDRKPALRCQLYAHHRRPAAPQPFAHTPVACHPCRDARPTGQRKLFQL